MTRSDIGPAMLSELGAASMTGIPLVFLDIKGDPTYVWGGIGDLVWDGQTWGGVGDIGRIGPVVSDAKGAIPNLEVSLNGIESDLLTHAKSALYSGRTARVYFGCFDDDFNLLDEPALFFAGRMSSMPVFDGAEAGISITIESRLASMSDNRPAYRTDEDHQRRHPGDRFFDAVASVAKKTIYWGLKQQSPAPRPSSSPAGVLNPRTFQRGGL